MLGVVKNVACGPNDSWRLLFWTTLFLRRGGQEGGTFHGKLVLEHKIFKTDFKEFQRMVKFYAFLKKSTEFFAMIVVYKGVEFRLS